MTKHFLKPAHLSYAKRLKEVEGLSHRQIANRLNELLNPKAGERFNVGDVRKLLSGVNSAVEDSRHYRQIGRILDETFDPKEGVSSDILLETSDTQKSTDDCENTPHTPSNRNGGET